MRGTWRSNLDGCGLELKMTEKELTDQNEATATTEKVTLVKLADGGGFGMNIDTDGVVVGYVGEGGAAETAGIAVGSIITAVNNLGVSGKDQVVAQLMTTGASADFTVKPPKATEKSTIDTVIQLSKQMDESSLRQIIGGKSVPNPFGIAQRVLMCQAATVDGVQVAEGRPLAVSEHFCWPDVLYCSNQMDV